VSALPRSVLASTLLRSFTIQASWNYRTLLGCGFAFALIPVLRTIYADRPDEYQLAVQRHTGVFNSHPYFAPMALGAVAMLEASEAPEVVDRFKNAVRGSLGSLGDRLIWSGFRPLCILIALAAVLLGAGWGLVTFGFLTLYNLGHVATRVWALRFGVAHGRKLGEELRNVPVEQLQHLMQTAAAFFLGLVLAVTVSGHALESPPQVLVIASALAAAALGARFGGATRIPVVILMTAIALIAMMVGLLA